MGQWQGSSELAQRRSARRRLLLRCCSSEGRLPTEHSGELYLWFGFCFQQRGFSLAVVQASLMLDSLRFLPKGTGTFKYLVPPCWSSSSEKNILHTYHMLQNLPGGATQRAYRTWSPPPDVRLLAHGWPALTTCRIPSASGQRSSSIGP